MPVLCSNCGAPYHGRMVPATCHKPTTPSKAGDPTKPCRCAELDNGDGWDCPRCGEVFT